MKKQLNEARGVLEDTRAKLARAQDEINAKDAEVGGRDCVWGGGHGWIWNAFCRYCQAEWK